MCKSDSVSKITKLRLGLINGGRRINETMHARARMVLGCFTLSAPPMISLRLALAWGEYWLIIYTHTGDDLLTNISFNEILASHVILLLYMYGTRGYGNYK